MKVRLKDTKQSRQLGILKRKSKQRKKYTKKQVKKFSFKDIMNQNQDETQADL